MWSGQWSLEQGSEKQPLATGPVFRWPIRCCVSVLTRGQAAKENRLRMSAVYSHPVISYHITRVKAGKGPGKSPMPSCWGKTPGSPLYSRSEGAGVHKMQPHYAPPSVALTHGGHARIPLGAAVQGPSPGSEIQKRGGGGGEFLGTIDV